MEQPRPAKPKPAKLTHQEKMIALGAGSFFVFFLIILIIAISTLPKTTNLASTNTSSKTPTQPQTTQQTPPTQPSQPKTLNPQPQKLTADQKQQVSTDLNNGLAHYVDTWHQGEQILGTTQYADANAGLAAIDDPNTAAAKFSVWRQYTKIEQDVTTYLNAFKSADAFYNATNEPDAISNYRDDLGTLQADISKWVSDAVGWQIQTTNNATMAKDVQTINNDISQVKSDITTTLAAD